jgi:hypothetical protein
MYIRAASRIEKGIFSGGVSASGVLNDASGTVFKQCQFNSTGLAAATGGCIAANANMTAAICTFKTGTASQGIAGPGAKDLYNCDFYGGAGGVLITTGTFKNNIFYNVTNPIVGGSATFMTNSAWNGDVSTWGTGCVSLTGSPFIQTPVFASDFRLNWGAWANGGVSIAGVTDGLDLLELSYRPDAISMGAVQYWGQGPDEDLIIP